MEPCFPRRALPGPRERDVVVATYLPYREWSLHAPLVACADSLGYKGTSLIRNRPPPRTLQ